MSDSDDNPSLDDSQQVWEMITHQVEAFIESWESEGPPPQLSEFVPQAADVVRRLTLVELLKVDMEYRWSRHTQDHCDTVLLVEDYLRHFPELADGGVPCDLLYEEYHIRNRFGDEVTPSEYLHRFPDQADQLQQLIGVASIERTTTLLGGRLPPNNIAPGQTIDDFDLLTRLGKGAFGAVFLARQRSMQRLVALKISANVGNEPQTLAQFDHPHVVRVYDERILEDRKLRLLYMQYLPGGTLSDVVDMIRQVPVEQRTGKTILAAIDRELEKNGESPPTSSTSRAILAAMDWPQAICWLAIRLVSALEHAHERNVLHRDVKPANILLNAEGDPKLVDFNISFCSKLEGATPAAYFGGSLAYMSPEQLQAFHPGNPLEPDSLDRRADTYSLGLVLWELLTGERPFRDEQLEGDWLATLDAMIERRQAGVQSSIVDSVPSAYPIELTQILLKCLAPNPEDRYDSEDELAAEFRLCLQPEAQKLLRTPTSGWLSFARQHPQIALPLLAFIPNAVAGVFNSVYNEGYIVGQSQAAQEVFSNTRMAVNAVTFPACLFVLALVIWPLSNVFSRMKRSEDPAVDQLPALRRRTLKLGQLTAVIGIVGWIVAGFVYPASFHLAGIEVKASDYVHFMGSMALCGLIAAIYPFFGLTFISIRSLYGAFVQPGAMNKEDGALLEWLNRMTWVYLALAAALPMLGVVLLVSLGPEQSRWTLGILCTGGLFGFALAVWLARAIQNDLATLAHVVSPADDVGLMGTTHVHSG